MTRPTSAATDTTEFLTDLDGGQFDMQLSVALSRVAAACHDHAKKGKVSITLDFDPIEGSNQVRIKHTLAYKAPTETGSSSEDSERSTLMHVGQFGKLSIAQVPLNLSKHPGLDLGTN